MLEKLRKAQRGPEDYFGHLNHLEEYNQARTGFSMHRDSDVLDISNFETILFDLQTSFPDDVEVDEANHWAVGWIKEILVTARIDPERPIVEDNVHPAFIAAMEWHKSLEDYPVADEHDLSEREYEDAIDTLVNCYDIPDEKAHEVYEWLYDEYQCSRSDDYRNDRVEEAKRACGIPTDD